MMESRYQDGSGSGKLNVVSFGIFRRICLSIKKKLWWFDDFRETLMEKCKWNDRNGKNSNFVEISERNLK